MGRILIYIMVWAGILFSACTQDDSPELQAQEEQLTQINASVVFDAQDFSSDSQIVPMRSANIPYYNFALCNSEFVVLRDLGDKYQVINFESHKEEVAMKIDKSTVYSLSDFNIKNTKLVLQEGKYLAYLMINGPVRAFNIIPQKGDTLPKNWSVIEGPESYLNGIRAMYFQSISFEVERNEGLNGPQEQDLFFDKMTRFCSPVRFIHYINGANLNELYVYMNIRGKKNAIPMGITATGEFLMSTDDSEVLFNGVGKQRFVTLYRNAALSLTNDSWSLPSYRNSGKTSLFVPVADDVKEVRLELEITSIEDSFTGYFSGSVKIPVTLRRDSISEIFLETLPKGLEVSYDDQKAFRSKWEALHPDIPYQYLEYN